VRCLFIDKNGDGGLDLALRAWEDGHDVRYFLKAYDERTRPIGKGLVERVADFRSSMRWADLVLLTQNDYCMTEIDGWAAEGMPIIGGSAESAKWENDRLYGMQVFRKAGIPVPPVREFTDYDAAIRHVEKAGEPMFSKPCWDGADKALSCQSGSPSDPAFMLKRWKRRYGRPKGTFILQEKIEGVEFAVGGWFGPDGFAPGFEEDFEEKKLMAGSLGPATGEMGTTIRFVARSKLADKVLKPLIPQLERIGYVGSINVNCIVDEKGQPWPLEFTMRFGWPASNINTALGENVDFFYGVAVGKPPKRTLNTVAVGVVMALPPFPGRISDYEDVIGLPMRVPPRFRVGWHPAEMMAADADDETASAGDYLGVATGTGASVKEAAERAYRTLRAIEIPGSPFWRVDIGRRLRRDLPRLQVHGYASGMSFS
jgi:phosphoribosylamine---glycine ligase